MKKNIEGKEVKITEAGYLYVDGVKIETQHNGMRAPGGRVTPLNQPDVKLVGQAVLDACCEWASKHYRMA